MDKTHVLRITESDVGTANQRSEWVSLGTDTIVVARGLKPTNGELVETLSDKDREVYAIGDCVRPRAVLKAIWEEDHTARLT